MSFFPRSILLATDGSDEAGLATQAAAELSKATGSEVHIAYVLPTEAQLIGPHVYTDEIRESLIERAERDARASQWCSGGVKCVPVKYQDTLSLRKFGLPKRF